MGKPKKIILCGGGTGGHIFPMLAIAEEFKKKNSNNKILFVGSSDRMEMEIVPKYNYPIYGLDYKNFRRRKDIELKFYELKNLYCLYPP